MSELSGLVAGAAEWVRMKDDAEARRNDPEANFDLDELAEINDDADTLLRRLAALAPAKHPCPHNETAIRSSRWVCEACGVCLDDVDVQAGDLDAVMARSGVETAATSAEVRQAVFPALRLSPLV